VGRPGRLEDGARGGRVASFQFDRGQRGGGYGIVGFGGHGGLGMVARAVGVTIAGSECGKASVSRSVGGVEAEDLAIGIAGRDHRAASVQHEGAFKPGLGAARVAAQGGIAMEHSVAQAALLAQQAGHADQREWINHGITKQVGEQGFGSRAVARREGMPGLTEPIVGHDPSFKGGEGVKSSRAMTAKRKGAGIAAHPRSFGFRF